MKHLAATQLTEDQWFKRCCVLVIVCICLGFGWLGQQALVVAKQQLAPQSEVVAKVMLKPTPKPIAPEPIKPREPKVEPPKVAQTKPKSVPEPKSQPKPAKPKPTPETPKPQAMPTQITEQVRPAPPKAAPEPNSREIARAQAKQAGLMSMQAQLVAMRSLGAVSNSATKTRQLEALKTVNESQLAQLATGRSGERASAEIAAQTSQRIASYSGNTRADQTDFAQGLALANAPQLRQVARPASLPSRDQAEIRQVFEANKAAVLSIFARAQRSNQTLGGKLVVEIEIDDSGAVVAGSIVSSELNDPALETKILRRIKMLNFGIAEAATMKTLYTFNFMPA